MKILPIFDSQTDNSHNILWTVCFPEDVDLDEDIKQEIDVFAKLMDQWADTFYLQNFFIENQPDLSDNPFWKGISIDKAIDKVIDEALDFQEELLKIEQEPETDKAKHINQIFENLHTTEFIFRKNKDQSFKKGKPDYVKPMLRLYGILLEDNTIVITGGAIKLTDKMDRPHLENELKNLERVKAFLKDENIIDRGGLLDLYDQQD